MPPSLRPLIWFYIMNIIIISALYFFSSPRSRWSEARWRRRGGEKREAGAIQQLSAEPLQRACRDGWPRPSAVSGHASVGSHTASLSQCFLRSSLELFSPEKQNKCFVIDKLAGSCFLSSPHRHCFLTRCHSDAAVYTRPASPAWSSSSVRAAATTPEDTGEQAAPQPWPSASHLRGTHLPPPALPSTSGHPSSSRGMYSAPQGTSAGLLACS